MASLPAASPKNAARDSGKIKQKSYCAGALVAAGAFVDGISGVVAGGVDVSACFWQPVNSPTPTNPNTAANNNIFFMGV
jgi:hypothetical protein